MTTYCYIACMQNNTTSIVPHYELPISIFNISQGCHYGRGSFITSATDCTMQNRKTKRQNKTYLRQQRAIELRLTEKTQNLSEAINNRFIGEYNGWYDYPAWLLYRQLILNKISQMKSAAINHNLEIIDAYIAYIAKENHPLVFTLLTEQNSIFKCFIERLVYLNSYDKEKIKGSTIDAFSHNKRYVFPGLSDTLNRYIENEIRFYTEKKIRDGYSLSGSIVQPHYQAKTEQFIRNIGYSVCFPTRTAFSIHSIALLGLQNPLDKTSIMISDDGYIKVKDIEGYIGAWNLLTGEPYDIESRRFRKQEWSKKELYENRPYLNYADVIEFKGKDHYHVSMCCESVCCRNCNTRTTLYLYQKPTFYSWLCQIAFENSSNDNDELDKLLQSNTMQDVRGFVKTNLKEAIKEKKRENTMNIKNCWTDVYE
jgi:hypothetical protein